MQAKERRAWLMALLLIERARDREPIEQASKILLELPNAPARAPKRRRNIRKLIATLLATILLHHIPASCAHAAAGDITPGPDAGDPDYYCGTL